MNATVQRAVAILDKPCFPDWTGRQNERRDGIRSMVKFGQSHVRAHAVPGAPDAWLLEAHRATLCSVGGTAHLLAVWLTGPKIEPPLAWCEQNSPGSGTAQDGPSCLPKLPQKIKEN